MVRILKAFRQDVFNYFVTGSFGDILCKPDELKTGDSKAHNFGDPVQYYEYLGVVSGEKESKEWAKFADVRCSLWFKNCLRVLQMDFDPAVKDNFMMCISPSVRDATAKKAKNLRDRRAVELQRMYAAEGYVEVLCLGCESGTCYLCSLSMVGVGVKCVC